MIKLFDSIATLEFIDSKATIEKKVAAGMHAKDGEYVKFNEECDCNGPVSIFIIITCKISYTVMLIYIKIIRTRTIFNFYIILIYLILY